MTSSTNNSTIAVVIAVWTIGCALAVSASSTAFSAVAVVARGRFSNTMVAASCDSRTTGSVFIAGSIS